MSILTTSDAVNIIAKYPTEQSTTRQILSKKQEEIQRQKLILEQLIVSDASLAQIQAQNAIVNTLMEEIGSNMVYVRLLDKSKKAADVVLNVEAGVTGAIQSSNYNLNSFSGTQGPTGPTGPPGPSPSIPLDSSPILNSSNIISSAGMYNAIASLGSTSVPTVFYKTFCRDNEVVLLPFDGANNSTTTEDYGSLCVTSSFSFDAGAKLSNSKVKFGSTSLNGTGRLYNDNLPHICHSNFTLECWFLITSIGGYDEIVKWGTGGASIILGVDGAYKPYLQINNVKATSSVAISLNTWYHIAAVRTDITNNYLYVNGVPRGQVTLSNATVRDIGWTNTMVFGNGNIYISNARMTYKEKLYLNSFTPPTSAFTTIPTNKLPLYDNPSAGQIVTDGINYYIYTNNTIKRWKRINFDS